MSLQDIELFQGRPTIARDTEVLGGVLRAGHAVAVDYDEVPEPYEFVYEYIDRQLPDDRQISPFFTALNVVYGVQEAVAFSKPVAGRVLRSQADQRNMDRIGRDDVVGLSEFIKAGGGICYHLALIDAVMLRLLQNRRGLPGTVSIDRQTDQPESHTWVRYVADGEKVALDASVPHVALIGSMDQLDQQYMRPYEKPSVRLL
jgi:hypothetical protein